MPRERLATGCLTGRFVLSVNRLIWREIDDEVIALDLPTSTYLSANDTGSLLLSCLRGGASVEDLTALLCEEFHIDGEEARLDASDFLADLLERKLVERTGV